MSYDGYIYPEWSGLNDNDASMRLEDALKHAIQTVRHVWKDPTRESREVMARHITGSECISLLFALERALASHDPAADLPRYGEKENDK